jgi:hypothetical protein
MKRTCALLAPPFHDLLYKRFLLKKISLAQLNQGTGDLSQLGLEREESEG